MEPLLEELITYSSGVVGAIAVLWGGIYTKGRYVNWRRKQGTKNALQYIINLQEVNDLPRIFRSNAYFKKPDGNLVPTKIIWRHPVVLDSVKSRKDEYIQDVLSLTPQEEADAVSLSRPRALGKTIEFHVLFHQYKEHI